MREMKKLFVVLCAFLSISVSASQRLVVVDGSLTEIVYLLGAEKDVVAVDTTSVYPPAVKKLPNVGYLRALSAEGVLSAKPSLVITTPSAGPKTALEQIKEAGINVQQVPSEYSIEGLFTKVSTLGELLNKQQQAKILAADIESQLKPIQPIISGDYVADKKKPKVLFFLGMQGNQYMAAGKGTQADAVVNIINAENALADDVHGYKPLSHETVLTLDADVIVVAATRDTESAIKHLQSLKMTKAHQNNQVAVIHASTLLGFGPRFPEALKKLVQVSYPEFVW